MIAISDEEAGVHHFSFKRRVSLFMTLVYSTASSFLCFGDEVAVALFLCATDFFYFLLWYVFARLKTVLLCY